MNGEGRTDSKKVKIAAVLIVILIVASSILYSEFGKGPKQTESERLILTASDMGPNWTTPQEGPLMWNASTLKMVDSATHLAFVPSNQSVAIQLIITVFNSTASCRTVYQDINAAFNDSTDFYNYTLFQIGDGGFMRWENGDRYIGTPLIYYMQGNVLCNIFFDIDPWEYHPWDTGVALQMAQKQESKIVSDLGPNT